MQNEWIKSSERKPNLVDNFMVIIAFNFEGELFVGTGWWIPERGVWQQTGSGDLEWSEEKVTHWMPFPKHPDLEEKPIVLERYVISPDGKMSVETP